MNLTNIIKQYNLNESVSLQLIKESADNIVCSVGDKNKKILRISKRLPIGDIEFEFAIFEYLSKNNFLVPKWNKTKDGKIFARNGNTIAVLFDFLDGYQVKVNKDNLPNKNQAYVAGKNLALLHNIGLNFKSDLPRKRNIFSELKRALGKNKIFISGLEGGKEFIKQVEDAIEFGEEDKSINGLIHNDYRPGNVIFKNDNEISGVIDFDWSCNGSIIKDLALAVVEWSFPDGRIKPDKELFDEFLAGYNSVAKTKYEKGILLYFWIKFTTLSDACTFFADANEGQYSDKVINNVDQCYMYQKFLYFLKQS